MVEHVNDGYGDEVVVTQSDREALADALQAAAEHPVKPSLTEEAERLRKLQDEQLQVAKAKLGSGDAVNVDPALANHSKWLTERHGPVIGMSEGPGATPGDLVVDRFKQAEMNLQWLTVHLPDIGFSRTRGTVDQWSHQSGVSIDMGYTMGECWVRAFTPGARRKNAGPVWTRRVMGWSGWDSVEDGSRETLRGVLADLAALAESWDSGETPGGSPEGGKRTLGFALLTPNATLPTRTYPDDAGFDLYTVEETVLDPGRFVDVPLGVSVGLPDGFWARLTGRSSTLRNWGVLVNEGIIDTGYTGPLFAGCLLVDPEASGSVVLPAGVRIAQLIIHRNTTALFTPVEVDGHPDTERGVRGFGSSGK